MKRHGIWQLTTILALAILSLSGCGASTGKIAGRVHTMADAFAKERPLPSATVSLRDASSAQNDPKGLISEIKTDEQGNYAFSEVKPGSYKLVISIRSLGPCGGIEIKEPWMIVGVQGQDQAGRTTFGLSASTQKDLSVTAGSEIQLDLELNNNCPYAS
jgi:hypothetical protein